jgi:hypothetical protein
MIFSNYREIVTPEEAKRPYWRILPPAQAENVVPMARHQFRNCGANVRPFGKGPGSPGTGSLI